MTTEQDPDSLTPEAGADHGSLPRWGKDDLPEPPPFSGRNLFRVIGPGAILLVASTGGGEWLVGPAVGVQYGVSVFWVVTIAVVLQVVFNLESLRYTLYTGEPMITGIMRLSPGSRFWAIVYSIFGVATLGLPSLAAACAAVLFAAFAGHMPLESDANVLAYVSYGVIALGVGILLFGKTIERMLEHVSWFMLVFIFLFLGIVNVFFVPLSNWSKTFWGFLQFVQVPAGIDVVLLGALASSAGAGGIGNLVISNWARDKGFGMGAKVGAIGSAFSRRHITLSGSGKIFPVTAENLRRWKVWWNYVNADQVWLWGTGAFLGMFLNVNLTTAIIPPGSDISQIAAGAYQAEYMARNLWSGFWLLALLNGFWVLFSTHLGNTDVLIRTVTDMIWAGSPRVRAWRRGNASSVYYIALFVFTVWGLWTINWGTAMALFKVGANIGGLILGVAGFQVLRVNTRFLPNELQPPLWRKLALAACSVFYGAMFSIVVWSQLF